MAKPIYDEVRARDHSRCRVCGTAQMVEVHHIQYRSQGGPDEAWNLISLCKLCHMRAHGTETPRLKRDLLHAMVEFGVSGNVRIVSCRTCQLRDADYLCRVHDEVVDPTHSCESWVEN